MLLSRAADLCEGIADFVYFVFCTCWKWNLYAISFKGRQQESDCSFKERRNCSTIGGRFLLSRGISRRIFQFQISSLQRSTNPTVTRQIYVDGVIGFRFLKAMSRDQTVAMDFLGVEKSPAKNERETDINSVTSHAKHETAPNDETTNGTVLPCSSSEMNTVNSGNGPILKSDFAQAFSLFSKYFREKGNATAAMGLSDKFNLSKPLEHHTNDDTKGTKLAGDDNVSTHLGLFPQQTGFGSLRSISGTEQKIVAPMITQPWPFRGVMQNASAQGMRSVAPPTSTMKPPAAQLTIFYAGMVNVYDDVPADKAQAIMLLAGSGNLMNSNMVKAGNFSQQIACTTPPASTPLSSVARTSLSLQTNGANTDTPIPTMPLSSGPNPHHPIRKLQADLPIARKHSLQRFLEKRKDRLVTKAPYTSSAPKKPDGDEAPISTNSPTKHSPSRSISPLTPSSPSPTLTSRPPSACCNESSTPQEASASPVSVQMS